jgi:4-amino-4-deoxy-L-arabinose transferase-like glycosyltransferase
LFAAILFLAPLRVGDLAGYDDARFAVVAKGIVQSGDWLDIRSNGSPALEHPPLFAWMQAPLFLLFGFSDSLAKLPSALCGIGVILLVYWLGRRLTQDKLAALLAMFVLCATIYFVKYTAHAMTDVPFTLFFLCAVCAWLRGVGEEEGDGPRWLLVAGAFVAAANMTRAMAGLALPLLFVLDAVLNRRRRPSLTYASAALFIAFLPPVAYYAQWIYRYGGGFFVSHSNYLNEEVFGPLTPAWRRYTGVLEYAAMLLKSYWPWLPAMLAGLVIVLRGKQPDQRLLALWAAVVFALCAVTRSRVLRYMLPAYPAFSVLASIGLMRFLPRYIPNALRILIPAYGVVALGIALFPPVTWQATDTRPIALAATAATKPGELVTFYDHTGTPRWDETNQILWYGDRQLIILRKPEDLAPELADPQTTVFIVDRDTYRQAIQPHLANRILAQHGSLVCVRLLLT